MITSRGRWPTLEQILCRQKLLKWMMYTSGVDVNIAARTDGGLALLEARAKCRYCLHEKACRRWLESVDGPQLPPKFCPNARFFVSCRTRSCSSEPSNLSKALQRAPTEFSEHQGRTNSYSQHLRMK